MHDMMKYGRKYHLFSRVGSEAQEDRQRSRLIFGSGFNVCIQLGENVAVFVKSKDDGKTGVEVVSRAKLVTNITAVNWTEEIFELLKKKLG